MRFHYIASDINGEVKEGSLEASSSAAVLDWMVRQGLRPISIKALGESRWKSFWRRFAPWEEVISIEDKIFLTRYLALMLKVGTDLFRAIDILIADFDKPALKNFLMEIRDILGKGQPFYTAFANYPKYFSAVFVSLIKAGENSGNLERVFEILSSNLEKEKELRGKLRSSLTYPIVLIVLSLIVLFLMLTFTLPRIAATFLTGGFEVPTFSRFVFGVGLFLHQYFLFILFLLLASLFGLWFFIVRTPTGRRLIERLAYRLPVVRDILYKTALQRFASTLASLLRSGTPILEALETTADTVGSEELKAALIHISREGIAKGLTVGEAFRRETFFPRVVVNLIAISEKGGHLEEVLETLAGFYETESDTALRTLVSFLEPVLLVGIGLVVGTIALAIIVPIYQLVGKI
jgi:type II secretory pathway component PulF